MAACLTELNAIRSARKVNSVDCPCRTGMFQRPACTGSACDTPRCPAPKHVPIQSVSAFLCQSLRLMSTRCRRLQATDLALTLLERGARGLATGGAASSGLCCAPALDLPRFAGLSFGASIDFSFGVTSAMPFVAASTAFCRQGTKHSKREDRLDGVCKARLRAESQELYPSPRGGGSSFSCGGQSKVLTDCSL